MPRLTVSLVTYKNPFSELKELFASLQRCNEIVAWVVVDNSAMVDAVASNELAKAVQSYGGHFIPAPSNGGFGAGHNIAINRLADTPSEFHLFVNPDILFDDHVLPGLIQLLDQRPDVGHVMPKILYADGRIQRLNKLQPTLFDFTARRFLPGFLRPLMQTYLDRFELTGTYDAEFSNVPFLSGCFIFMRRRIFERIGGFNEGYFLYMEDAELGRLALRISKNLYWPEVSITHGYQRGSHNSLWLTWVTIRASCKYFNRFGWFWDRERSKINREALNQRRTMLQQKASGKADS